MTQKFSNQGNRFRQFGSWPKRKGDHFDNSNNNFKRVKRFDSNGNSSFGGNQRSFDNSNSRY